MPLGLTSLFSASTLMSGNRTTALNALGWMMVLLLSGTLGAASLKVPDWIIMMMAGFLSVNFLVFVGAYIFFAIKAPDYLRSESYSIQKLALEKRVFGDSTGGTFPFKEIDPSNPVIGTSSSLQIEQKL